MNVAHDDSGSQERESLDKLTTRVTKGLFRDLKSSVALHWTGKHEELGRGNVLSNMAELKISCRATVEWMNRLFDSFASVARWLLLLLLPPLSECSSSNNNSRTISKESLLQCTVHAFTHCFRRRRRLRWLTLIGISKSVWPLVALFGSWPRKCVASL